MRTHGNNEAPVMRGQLTVTGGASSSGVFASTLNPFGVDVLIHQVFLRRTTKSTGASTVDVGTAADGTTSSDNLLDGVTASATEAIESTVLDHGTNGKAGIVWADDEYLNVAEASGNVDGLVAVLYYEYSLL